ncbi:MAG: sel1 repeat family protein [Synergistaceae bacterium]|jgi:hypothetical protein|nr:sel1 repeat family protein [Synergistaceae bacterium]
MKNIFLNIFLALLLVSLSFERAGAGYEEGVEARGEGDYAEALHQWLVASDDPRCMTAIGVMYDYGEGLPKDDVRAAEWYRKAADRGEYRAIAQLAGFSLTGAGGVARAPAEWRKRLEDIEGSDDYADSVLASFYLDGHGGPRDLGKAASILRTLTRKGYGQLEPVARQAERRLADQRGGVTEADVLTAGMASGNASFDRTWRDKRIVVSGRVATVDRLGGQGYVVKFGSARPSSAPKDNILAIFYDPSPGSELVSLKPGTFVKLDGVYVGRHPFPLEDCAFTLFGCTLIEVVSEDVRP